MVIYKVERLQLSCYITIDETRRRFKTWIFKEPYCKENASFLRRGFSHFTYCILWVTNCVTTELPKEISKEYWKGSSMIKNVMINVRVSQSSPYRPQGKYNILAEWIKASGSVGVNILVCFYKSLHKWRTNIVRLCRQVAWYGSSCKMPD